MSDTSKTEPAKTPFRFRDLGKMFGGVQSSGRQFGILGALVVIIVLFQILTGGKTLDPVNLINLVNGTPTCSCSPWAWSWSSWPATSICR